MKTALVIGASRGIGHEFVSQLLSSGYFVYATARKQEDIEKLNQLGSIGLELDVSSPSSVAGLGWHLDGIKIDLCLYVAGVYGPNLGATEVPNSSDFDAVMHVNVLGAMQLIPIIAPALETSRGRLVFISSLMGSIEATQSSFGWIYRASKAALNMAVKAAAFDYPNAILTLMNPGWVQTAMGGSQAPTTPSASVSGMLEVIEELTLKDSGSFKSFDQRAMSW